MSKFSDLQVMLDFLADKKLGFAGYSFTDKKFGNTVYNELKTKGFELYPINPKGGQTRDGQKVYSEVSELPADVKKLYIITPKTQTAAVVEAAAQQGIEGVWIQQSADTPEALEIARKHNMLAIYGRCIMMYAEPKGFHRFHKNLTKIFGLHPK